MPAANNFTSHPLPGYVASECLLRRPAALALKRVQADLAAQGLSLKVYDCYRPTRAVAAMAHWAAQDAGAQPDTSTLLSGAEEEPAVRAWIYRQPFGAFARRCRRSHHRAERMRRRKRLTIPRAHYGSCAGPADAASAAQQRRYGHRLRLFQCEQLHAYAASITPAQRARRRILLQAMERQGFKNYFREWWHFSYPAADTRTEYNFPVR